MSYLTQRCPDKQAGLHSTLAQNPLLQYDELALVQPIKSKSVWQSGSFMNKTMIPQSHPSIRINQHHNFNHIPPLLMPPRTMFDNNNKTKSMLA